MTRRGFTLVELVVTMAVMGILGGALVRLTINQSRYVGEQEALMEARQTSRQAMNLLATELRMVSDNGVVQVSFDSITARVPFAFGMLCGVSGGAQIATLLPSDSAAWANALSPGVAYRSGGSFTPAGGITVSASTASSACTADSIREVSGGRLVALSPANVLSSANTGDLMYLYETVTYRFATSGELAGRRALYRVSGGTAEELLAPFASTAGFAYLTGSRLAVTTTAPTDLDSISGFELRLIAESSVTPSGRTAPITYDLRPRVRLGNKPLD
jgi:prepilin-type N-terminal cleavage/methylation domain-containing protein